MRKINIIILLMSLFVASTLHAQTGAYDVRFNIPSSEAQSFCDAQQLYVDIEIKATSGGEEFGIGEQNYRFNFNKDALANPTIIEELELISGQPLEGNSFYSKHNLNGSLDSVVSYNIEHLFGPGVTVVAERWLAVGRVGFDVVDMDACFDLVWHDTNLFPTTFIGELINGSREDASGIGYTNTGDCYANICILPIELVSFSGEESNCRVHLSWSTATEENTAHFIVQRSNNGIDFQDIGRVSAAGDSYDLLTYNFVDEQFGIHNYYRLKQVDIDSRYTYTDVIKVETDCYQSGDVIEVYPNPVYGNNEMTLKLEATSAESAQISVINIEGKTMSETPVQLSEGANMLHFSMTNLPSGTYFVEVKGATWNSTVQKIVKF